MKVFLILTNSLFLPKRTKTLFTPLGVMKMSKSSNGRLQITLPKGARELLDQLVDLQEIGGSHSEVARYLVETTKTAS